MEDFAAALDTARRHTDAWLATLPERPVPPLATTEEVMAALGERLPDHPSSPEETIDLLGRAGEPGLTAMSAGRFFGFVIGGSHPAALAADCLATAWDQNCGLRDLTPTHTAVEDLASAWLLDLLRLPAESAVGWTTGATMANFTALAAARDEMLRRAGWDAARLGLAGGPRVRVLVGDERHVAVDLALRYVGLGEPATVAANAQGLMRPDALAAALAEDGPGQSVPTVVVLQAGNIHSGASDPFTELCAIAHEHGAWVHVDGAFGLWAATSSTYRHLVDGVHEADSWATDAHKTLNVPYDCGIVVVRDASAIQAAMGVSGPYLIRDATCQPVDKVPEMSRRGRAFAAWAVLHSLGRSGVEDLVDGLCGHARAFGRAMAGIAGAEVVNEVVFTQVCVRFGSDERTRQVVAALLADGTTWMSGSIWQGQAIMRISVSNWATTEEDVSRSVEAVRRVVEQLDWGM